MLLALDVGNTNVTIGVFKRKEIIEVFRITTKLPRTSDEFGILISNLLKERIRRTRSESSDHWICCTEYHAFTDKWADQIF